MLRTAVSACCCSTAHACLQSLPCTPFCNTRCRVALVCRCARLPSPSSSGWSRTLSRTATRTTSELAWPPRNGTPAAVAVALPPCAPFECRGGVARQGSLVAWSAVAQADPKAAPSGPATFYRRPAGRSLVPHTTLFGKRCMPAPIPPRTCVHATCLNAQPYPPFDASCPSLLDAPGPLPVRTPAAIHCFA